MNRSKTIAKQPVFNGYGFEARGMEYVVVDGAWRAFPVGGRKIALNLTRSESEWLDSLFVIHAEVPA